MTPLFLLTLALAADLKPGVDFYPHAGQKPEDAAKNMTVPPGFSVKLFAGEPDVHQPIGFCIDDRGRLWVAEAYTYPKRHPFDGPILPDVEKAKGDRIRILEDTDGDGHFDKVTTVIEGLNLVSGIELGFGGIYVGAAPYFLFIPLDEKTDKPTGPPQILLDGWGYQDTHETLNSFTWGPDGWLYGCHGVFTHSKVGKPGTPDKDRTPINAGVWRYHPTKHTFEVFAHGTSNPWGLDYNAKGDFFVEACVIPHMWHIVQGGRYARQAGQHFNPYTYDDIQTIAKHRHWQGANQWAGIASSGSLGGGHAHAGLVCYQGGLWPKEYHGKLFMGNLHGHRINVDELTPKGSSYTADRNPDFLLSNDSTCIINSMQASPDGNLYFSDWSDKQVCHNNTPEIWDRTNGRIFKIVHKDTKPLKDFDLKKSSDLELVKLQTSDNEWMARHARRILQERWTGANVATMARRDEYLGLLKAIHGLRNDSYEAIQRLRGLWLLYTVGDSLGIHTDDKDPHVNAWIQRLWIQNVAAQYVGKEDAIPSMMWNVTDLAAGRDQIVRRDIASAFTKLPRKYQLETLPRLVNYPEDANDAILPFLYWYALEPICTNAPKDALAIAKNGKIPQLLPLAARRIGAIGTTDVMAVLVNALASEKSTPHQIAYLRGLQEGVIGKRATIAPAGWSEVYATLAKSDSAEVRNTALALAVKFGDSAAFETLRKTIADTKADTAVRQSAIAALLDARDKQLPAVLHGVVKEPNQRSVAIRALAAFDDANTPATILAVYGSLTSAEKRDALATLASRPAYATALLNAVAAKTIPAGDIPAETIRQLRNLGDKQLETLIAATWGTVRETPAERKKLIADWSKKLNANVTVKPDLSHGRAIFSKVCAQCHTLYGVGGKVGPEITGANRNDLGYLLENIFDPSAVIPKEYAATKLDLADGRVITGIIKAETGATLTVATATETLTVAVKDVDKRTPSDLSMMPDDLMKPLNETEVRALVAYLRHNQQVPMKATVENAKEFFNGKNLDNWDGDKTLWTVKDGEIVGSTATGLKKNNFLVSQY